MRITVAARILSILSDWKPALTKTELSGRLGVSKSTVASALRSLDKKSLVFPTPGEELPVYATTKTAGRGRHGRYVEDIWQSNGEVPQTKYTEEQCQQFLNDGAGPTDMWF